jgi:hypothetical protein
MQFNYYVLFEASSDLDICHMKQGLEVDTGVANEVVYDFP